jgi:hypothetical protein
LLQLGQTSEGSLDNQDGSVAASKAPGIPQLLQRHVPAVFCRFAAEASGTESGSCFGGVLRLLGVSACDVASEGAGVFLTLKPSSVREAVVSA